MGVCRQVSGNTSQLQSLLPEFVKWWEGKANGGYGPMWRMDCLMDQKNFPNCLSVRPKTAAWTMILRQDLSALVGCAVLAPHCPTASDSRTASQ